MFDYQSFFNSVSTSFLNKAGKNTQLKITYSKNEMNEVIERIKKWNNSKSLVVVGRRNNDKTKSILLDFSQINNIHACHPPYYKESLFEKECVYLFPIIVKENSVIAIIYE